MIITIRISGQVDLSQKIKETLYRLRLRKKYSAVLLKPNTIILKLLKKIRNHVAYGDIDKETLRRLIEKRAQPKSKNKKIDIAKAMEQIEKTSSDKWDIKPFFRLHSPRGGIDSKKHFGVTKNAVLGDNKTKINNLIRRML